MNRRKPLMRFAVVPNEDGVDTMAAVLRKAAKAAAGAVDCQGGTQGEFCRQPGLQAFAAGYLAGFARHQGLRHGVDGEQHMPLLVAALVEEAPADLQSALSLLRFTARAAPSSRAELEVADSLADAAYLIGHLESLCGSRKLLGLVTELWGRPDAAGRYLTACDTAADRMQTHQPTASLRFNAAERVVIRKAFSPSGG